MKIAFRSLFPFLQLACLLLLPPPLFSTDLAMEGQPGHLLLRAGTHTSLRTSSTARSPRAVPLLALPRAQDRPPAATSPSPWPGQDRARRSLLARARALQVPQHSIPPALSLAPHSDAQNTAAAAQNTGEPRPAVDPPHRSSSAHADP